MKIEFYCRCGKRLRAREEMAGRRSLCPRCGAPVGIPSLKPTHRGAPAGSLTPAERRWRGPLDPEYDPVATTAASALPASGPVPKPTRRKGPDRLETHWYQCLLYPFYAGTQVPVLAGALAAATGGAVLLLPKLLDLRTEPSELLGWGALVAVGALLLLGYACSLPEGALTSAATGKAYVFWPGVNIFLALKSLGRCLAAFLAGPVFIAGGGVLYWIHCGDVGPLDWLILAEIAVLAVGYGVLALAAVSERGRWRDANPVRVAGLFRRLGFRAVAVAFAGTALTVAHGAVAVVAVDRIQERQPSGWVLLTAGYCSGLFFGTFLLRLVGVWFYRRRDTEPVAPAPSGESAAVSGGGAPANGPSTSTRLALAGTAHVAGLAGEGTRAAPGKAM